MFFYMQPHMHAQEYIKAMNQNTHCNKKDRLNLLDKI